MKNIFLIALTVCSMMVSFALACNSEDGKFGFLPKNDLKISQFSLFTSDITQEKYLQIINNIFNIYTPLVAEKGALLVLYPHWEDDTVNANANIWGKRWVINMYGGLARHPAVTEDALAMVMCHELGHFLGGAPKKIHRDKPFWPSVEGQADHFASMKCLRRVLEHEDNIRIVSQMNVDARVTQQCQLVYNNANEVALCQRIAMAAQSAANLSSAVRGLPLVSFGTTDTSTVAKTYEDHPLPQCRLDTYFSGILCNKSYDQDTDDKDPNVGFCTLSEGYKLGMRPLCWYKP
ncbi:MAG: hypothetical protein AABY53_05650 [Bdellovibrionota bacterium]